MGELSIGFVILRAWVVGIRHNGLLWVAPKYTIVFCHAAAIKAQP